MSPGMKLGGLPGGRPSEGMYGNGDRSENGRLVHGRKGIGKLAAFGTAGYLECTTVRNGELTAFGIDYDELRRLNPDQIPTWTR